MAKVFALRGADVYRVLDIENVDPRLQPAPAAPDALLKLRRTFAHLGACDDLARLADRALAALAHGFGIRHALMALLDETGGALYTLASLGYSASASARSRWARASSASPHARPSRCASTTAPATTPTTPRSRGPTRHRRASRCRCWPIRTARSRCR
jgi:hypothetical protein